VYLQEVVDERTVVPFRIEWRDTACVISGKRPPPLRLDKPLRLVIRDLVAAALEARGHVILNSRETADLALDIAVTECSTQFLGSVFNTGGLGFRPGDVLARVGARLRILRIVDGSLVAERNHLVEEKETILWNWRTGYLAPLARALSALGQTVADDDGLERAIQAAAAPS
jgi:hypothetical protein